MNTRKMISLTLLSLGLFGLMFSLPWTTNITAASPAPRVVPSGFMETEIKGLLFMREEEKVARDVYLTFYAQYKTPIFNNIASSEQTHMTQIKTLLDRYGLADPAAGKAIGVFSDPTLQQLYNTLVAQGKVSLTDALKVGVAVEETDIRDLTTYLAQTTHSDITRVYTNLRSASYNHLKSFNKLLGR